MSMERWQRSDDYIGEDYSKYFVLMTWRPNTWDRLGQSNYEFIKAELDAINANWLDANFGSWAFSFSSILIHKDDARAVELGNSLWEQMEAYPVLDDKRYSELQWEQAQDLWEHSDKELMCERTGIEACMSLDKQIPSDVFYWYLDNGWLN